MDQAKSQNITSRWPVITSGMVITALVVAVFPKVPGWMIYDRQAILSGQIWRLFTGHWVHFSASHLGYDLLALGVAGWIAETQRLARFGWLCLVSPWLIGMGLLVFEPRLEVYGGLSALAVAVIIYVSLHGLHGSRSWRMVCVAALLFFGGKLGYEVVTGQMLFATVNEGTPVVVSTASHLFGALIAASFYAVDRVFKIPAWRTGHPAWRW